MHAELTYLLLLLQGITAQSVFAQNATTFALTYGYPLLAFENLANQFLFLNATNYLYNVQQLSSPTNKTVVKPNVDTLYSSALLDVSQTDLILHVPEIPDSQFALFSFYDVYGDNFANVGAANINASGQYRLRAPTDGTSKFGVEKSSDGSTYVADIYSPTYYGNLLIRWGVSDTDLDVVHGYQSSDMLTTVNRTDIGSAPPLTELGVSKISPLSTTSPAIQVLDLLARYAPWCQPETDVSANEVNTMLAAAGISDGKYTMPAGVDIEAANKSAIVAATNAAVNSANVSISSMYYESETKLSFVEPTDEQRLEHHPPRPRRKLRQRHKLRLQSRNRLRRLPNASGPERRLSLLDQRLCTRPLFQLGWRRSE